MSRRSKYISLSDARDSREYEAYSNEIRTTGIFRRLDQIREIHGDRAASKFYRQHLHKYDPQLGPLNNAVKCSRKKLIDLIVNSGKKFDTTLILSAFNLDQITIIRFRR
jgi:hypothetical protein